MGNINTLAKGLKPSETLAIKARAMELKAQGKSIVDLCAGEPDIDTPEHIKEAARKALKDGKTKYTNVAGIPELREALSVKLQQENGIIAKPAEIVVTNGGKQALFNLFQVILEPGDEVVVIAPYWVSYPPMVELARGKAVIVHTTPAQGYKVSPNALAASLTSRTRCVIINSPSNPTGAAYSKEELAQLGQVLEKSQALICSDEVYEKEVYGGFTFCSFAKACPQLAARTVTVNAFSKSYSMTGWRVGYAAGPKDIIAAMGNYQSQVTSNVNSIAQYAALAALSGSHDFVAPMVESFNRRISLACDLLSKTPGLSVPNRPEGAFYLFVRIDGLRESLKKRGIQGSTDFTNLLLEDAGVAAVPGEAFGDDNAFRISVAAADKVIEEGVSRLCRMVSALS